MLSVMYYNVLHTENHITNCQKQQNTDTLRNDKAGYGLAAAQ